jgi:predicted DNA-binding transcriptional regulator YafY
MSALCQVLIMTRQARLFAIVEYLRGRRTGVTAQMLADRFDVTVRTIYRDLDALRDANLPLRAEQGRGGGYALDRHYSLPPINLNPREAAVLVAVATCAIQMRLVPFKATLSAALDKVRGALSTSAQRELLEVLKQLKYIGVPALPAPAAVRAAVEDAWFGQRPVALRYRRAQGDTGSRVVRIAGVVMERHMTLLDCVDVATGEERRLRLDRVEHAALT